MEEVRFASPCQRAATWNHVVSLERVVSTRVALVSCPAYSEDIMCSLHNI